MKNHKLAKKLTLAACMLAFSAPLHAEPVVPAMGDTGYNREPVPYPSGTPAPAPEAAPEAAPPQGEPNYVWQNQQPTGPNGVPQGEQSYDSAGNSGLPTPVQSGNVRYITGGIGDEERELLEAAKRDYDLHITNVDASGQFMGDTQITIKRSGGQQVLQANAGPMFYVQLAAGSYTVEALSNGETKVQKVVIRPNKASSLYLRW